MRLPDIYTSLNCKIVTEARKDSETGELCHDITMSTETETARNSLKQIGREIREQVLRAKR